MREAFNIYQRYTIPQLEKRKKTENQNVSLLKNLFPNYGEK